MPPTAPRCARCFRSRPRRAGREGGRQRRAQGLLASRGGAILSNSSGVARMSGPSAGRRDESSSRLPPRSTACSCEPRRTSHGLPETGVEAGSTRQPPVIPKWLRSTRPPSNSSNRCFPCASTAASLRPSSLGATPVTRARGCTASTASSSPTSRSSARAARRIVSPSGTSGTKNGPPRAGDEPSLDEQGQDGRLRHRLAVEALDRQPLPPASAGVIDERRE